MGLFWAFIFTVLSTFSPISCATQTFIVSVHNDLKPSTYSDVGDWYRSTIATLKSSKNTKTDLLHVYRTVFHGFSAELTSGQAEELQERCPEIIRVFPDRVRQLLTTRSPAFLGLDDRTTSASKGMVDESDTGSNVIIGFLDTGIWPERRSFHDEDLGPVPSRWKGKCVPAENFPTSLCNRKLIGARFYSSGYKVHFQDQADEFELKSPRDTIGHGTHTASTGAGRLVQNASFLDYFADGAARGIAPKARIAVYKVCWAKGCLESDLLAAMNDAVEDGVDIISFSIGGWPERYSDDPIAIGAFGVNERGVLFSAAAGNLGPFGLVTNTAPWITTVGAGTIDRNFPADLVLNDGTVLTGSSLYKGQSNKSLPLIYAGNASLVQNASEFAAYCFPRTLNPKLVRDKIVLCKRGGIAAVEKGLAVKKSGGAGVVVANVGVLGDGLLADAFLFPGLTITNSDREKLLYYIKTSSKPKASMVFHGTQIGVKPAPVLATFSSRGPNLISKYVLKPDLIAPGVNILAAWPDNVPPTDVSDDPRRLKFNILSGTSMSCPHVSGVAALLKGSHPDWTPTMIKSAMMTTAYTQDRDGNPLLDETNHNPSTPWGFGSGHVDPLKAVDPGLVYDLTVDDYLDFLCASDYSNKEIRVIARGRSVKCETRKNPWDLNYPALSVFFNASGPSNAEVSVIRTVKHVSDGAGNYTVTIANPDGFNVTVDRDTMEFTKKGEKQSYLVRIFSNDLKEPRGRFTNVFGKLTWSDGTHIVNSHILVFVV